MGYDYEKRWCYTYFLMAVACFLLSLQISYTGEEPVYILNTLEMLSYHDFSSTYIYGQLYARPPLFNWLMIPWVKWLGISSTPVVARMVSIIATLTTGVILFYWSKAQSKHPLAAFLAVIIYFSGDLLLRRGWIAYADPVYSLFTFGALICFWQAIHQKKLIYLMAMSLSIFLAILTKAFTVYIFLGCLGLSMMLVYRHRITVLNKYFMINSMLALLLPLYLCYKLDPTSFHGMWIDIASRTATTIDANWVKNIMIYPLKIAILFFPGTIILIYLYIRKKLFLIPLSLESHEKQKILLVFCVLSILPYWLSSKMQARYLAPIYPYIGFLVATQILHANINLRKVIYIFLSFMSLAILFQGLVLPSLHLHQYGDFTEFVQKLNSEIKVEQLFIEDESATGLAVATEFNLSDFRTTPLQRWGKQRPAYVLEHTKSTEAAWSKCYRIAEKSEICLSYYPSRSDKKVE